MQNQEKDHYIDEIGEIILQLHRTTGRLSAADGKFYMMKRAEVPQAMIIQELRNINRSLGEILEEIRK